MDPSPGDPALSVVLVAPYGFDAIRQTVRHLRAQSARDRIELVLVVPARESLGEDAGELGGFAALQVVEVGDLPTEARGYAAGIRQARAPVAVLAEDHCFPAPRWAEALIRAHQGRWAVVGPIVVNGNQESAVGWADFILGYGRWLDPTPGGPADFLPGHNSAYKRDLLLALYGAELDTWLEAECVLHWDLRARGHELLLEPAARTFHFSFSRLRSYLIASFHQARTFAGRRLPHEHARVLRRWLYVAATPLVPIVRLRRSLADLRRSARRPEHVLRVIPILVCGLVVSAVGEAIGYAFGVGDAPRRGSEYEYRRDRHLRQDDRAAMAVARFWT